MNGQLNPRSRSDTFGSKINRSHSPILAVSTPWLVIVAGSLLPILPMVSGIPFVPPFGYLLLHDFGADGIAFDKDKHTLYIGNLDRGQILRVAVNPEVMEPAANLLGPLAGLV